MSDWNEQILDDDKPIISSIDAFTQPEAVLISSEVPGKSPRFISKHQGPKKAMKPLTLCENFCHGTCTSGEKGADNYFKEKFMSGRSYFNSLSSLVITSLFISSACQPSASAPNVGGTPKGATAPVSETQNSDSSDNDGDGSSPASQDSRVGNEDKKSADNNPNPSTPAVQTEPLPEAKQAEVKQLFTGEWASSCIKVENPDVAGQFFSSTESWKLLADGSIEASYQDFDDADCQTPTQGFESYVVAVSKPVAVKELAAKHFYIEMNVMKEIDDNGTLADATRKFLIMVKFDVGTMTIDYPEDMTATTLSAEALKFTKK